MLRGGHASSGLAGEDTDSRGSSLARPCVPMPAARHPLLFWRQNSGDTGCGIHSLVIGVVGDAAFPRASARLCFWFPCLEGEEPRLYCTKDVCDVRYSKRERERPAKSHAIIQFGLYTYTNSRDPRPR